MLDLQQMPKLLAKYRARVEELKKSAPKSKSNNKKSMIALKPRKGLFECHYEIAKTLSQNIVEEEKRSFSLI